MLIIPSSIPGIGLKGTPFSERNRFQHPQMYSKSCLHYENAQ